MATEKPCHFWTRLAAIWDRFDHQHRQCSIKHRRLVNHPRAQPPFSSIDMILAPWCLRERLGNWRPSYVRANRSGGPGIRTRGPSNLHGNGRRGGPATPPPRLPPRVPARGPASTGPRRAARPGGAWSVQKPCGNIRFLDGLCDIDCATHEFWRPVGSVARMGQSPLVVRGSKGGRYFETHPLECS